MEETSISINKDKLASEAIKVLEQNWKSGFTIPTSKLYPFQWNWDSGFICLGHCWYNLDKAIQELTSLFSAQWQNGMIPHIVFHSENEKTYFPNHDFWNASINSGAPRTPKTSGITQPPVHGFILEYLLKSFPDNERLIEFIKYIFPKVIRSHKWFYRYRDPEREGLTFIFHPWESGRDNSPLWDDSLNRIEIKEGQIPYYERRDTSIASADERPTSSQYDRYVYLLELGKKHAYQDIGIFQDSPFVVQDTMMNTLLIKSNQSLINIGNRFGYDINEVKEWQQQSKKRFLEKLWDEELETFVVYDVRNNQSIRHKEIGGLTSLFAEIPNQLQASKMNGYLHDLHRRNYFICPSFDVDSHLFDSKRYWRGPIWPQMNWLVYHGLVNYGFNETAQIVQMDLVRLVHQLGFYEYFEAQKDKVDDMTKGYGGNHFSWTASCVIDLLNR